MAVSNEWVCAYAYQGLEGTANSCTFQHKWEEVVHALLTMAQINTSNDNYTTLTCSYHCCISLSTWSIWRIQDARCSSHCKYFVHQVSKKGNKSKVKFNKYQCHYKIKQTQKIKQILTDILLTTFASSASVTVVNSISAWNWPKKWHIKHQS